MAKVFITGGSGFLGRGLVARLSERHEVVALLRGDTTLATRVTTVRGDLLQPKSYAAALAHVDVVVHAAAATGNATPAEHHRTNFTGTVRLLEQCRHAGIGRVIFVSSIAVKFTKQWRYFYAHAKAQAEQAVASSGLRYCILRPTIVIGPGAPVLTGLTRLAARPRIPVFGSGRARVQPIFVDDLVTLILHTVEHDPGPEQLLELGGPETTTIERFLGRIHRLVSHSEPRFVHLPLTPLLPLLAVAEVVAYRAMPVTVGQLATFRNDGVAEPNALTDSHRSAMRGIEAMLQASLPA